MLDICKRFEDMAASYLDMGHPEMADDIHECMRESCVACMFSDSACFSHRQKDLTRGQFSVTIGTQPACRHIRNRVDHLAAVRLAMSVAQDIGGRVILLDDNERTIIHDEVEHDDSVLFV